MFHWNSTIPQTSHYRVAGLEHGETLIFGICLPLAAGSTQEELRKIFTLDSKATAIDEADSLTEVSLFLPDGTTFFLHLVTLLHSSSRMNPRTFTSTVPPEWRTGSSQRAGVQFNGKIEISIDFINYTSMIGVQ